MALERSKNPFRFVPNSTTRIDSDNDFAKFVPWETNCSARVHRPRSLAELLLLPHRPQVHLPLAAVFVEKSSTKTCGTKNILEK